MEVRNLCLTLLLFVATIVDQSTCTTLIHNQENDCNAKIQMLENDLKDTKLALSTLILTLLETKGDPDVAEAIHLQSKRDLPEANDSLLSQLPISSLLGLRGKDGKDGSNGKDGRDGNNGKDGKDGKDGNDGRGGAPGAKGDQGHDGIGIKGSPGADGFSGEKGDQGAPSSSGQKGETGLPGQPGQRGTAGAVGRGGATGQSGAKGDRGSSTDNAGAVFTRWGRTTCGNQSTLLYSGFTGGSRYDQTGGGVNYQCMPPTPEYNSYSPGGDTSYMAGTEFQSGSNGIFPNQAHQKNVPCARCYTNTRPAVMMLPAKRNCPSNWTREYEGYLMSEYYGHTRPATFECVDANPEYISGSSQDTNGALFYFVKQYVLAQESPTTVLLTSMTDS